MMTSKFDVIPLSGVGRTALKENDRKAKEDAARRRGRGLVVGVDEFPERDTVDDVDHKSGELTDEDAILGGAPGCGSGGECARRLSRIYDFDSGDTPGMTLYGCSESQFLISVSGSFIPDAFIFTRGWEYFMPYAFFSS